MKGMLGKVMVVVVVAALVALVALGSARQVSAQDNGGNDSNRAPGVPESWPYHGGRALKMALVMSVVGATDSMPRAVVEQLDSGKSVADVASEAGASEADVLAIYDEMITLRFERAVDNGRLPQSVAEGRIAWFQGAARQMIAQPGLTPAYPGLHELHATIIRAAAGASGIPRREIRSELHECRTLDEILAEEGYSGQDAVSTALTYIDGWLEALVADGQLADAQRQSWHDGIEAALTNMTTTPGVHVAGKECAEQ
ncbi:MAG: hypothetical protein ACRDIB_01385 [Ardenticatenaceae bacterium]